MNREAYEKALLDPADIFGAPEDVVEHPGLTREQKIEILRRWEYDVSEAAVAQEEGMAGETPPHLRRIAIALDGLGAGPRAGTASPTKHNA